MRQSIKKRKDQRKKDKIFVFLAFFVFAPIVAMLLGIGIVNYVIYPMFSQDGVTSDNGKPINNTVDFNSNSVDNNKEISSEDDQVNDNEQSLLINRNEISLYNIQVGSFSDIKNAEDLVKNMKRKGLGGFIVKTNNYKVFAGSFYNREEADETIQRVKEIYDDAFISTTTIGRNPISYSINDKKYVEAIIELFDTIDNCYGEEASLWNKAIQDKDKTFIKQVMINNTQLIEKKLVEINDKLTSDELNGNISDISTLILERKSLVSSLDNDSKSLIQGYCEFNQSLFNYLKR